MKKFIYLLFIAAVAAAVSGCSKSGTHSKKVLVLGIDGMDPRILNRLLEKGKMPNFQKFIEKGSFKNLYSSIPPQSPVAWSNFITGEGPDKHRIFDFVHRDSKTMAPFLSTTKVDEPEKVLSIGSLRLPLKAGKVELLRREPAFWQVLDRHNIPATIIKIPSNFPPAPTKAKTISGMGTPDIKGTYGDFSFYSDNPVFVYKKDISGGRIIPIEIEDGKFESKIYGPANIYKEGAPETAIDFTVYVDRETKTVRIDLQGKNIILSEGELSEWITLDFGMLPLVESISGICRIMITDIDQYFGLYISPININSEDPAMPISTPPDYSKTLAENIGFFYTQGMPEDTKAFEYDVFNLKNYLTQVKAVFQERIRMYKYIFNSWDSGVLFFYFSSLDQNTHMLWWESDPKSAIYNQEIFEKYGNLIDSFYMEMDKVLGYTLDKIDKSIPIIIMSDHGFAPYYKKFHLNNWLAENGYMSTFRKWKPGVDKFFQTVDWSKTKAYGLGINSLYINQKGRENNGIVPAEEKLALLRKIKEKLLQEKDPETGENVIKQVYITKEMYPDLASDEVPDMIVGYFRGYRCSDQSAVGEFGESIIEVNRDKWSGDHCIDYTEVPGIIITNRKITKDTCYLYDLMPTILKEYGINTHVVGSPVY